MKQGKSIVELAQEIERQKTTKRDFQVDAAAVEMKAITTTEQNGSEITSLALQPRGVEPFGITNHTHGQLSQYVGIPRPYYNRCQTAAPALLADQVNHWLTEKDGDRRMLRTLDGDARAWVSGRYRPLDYSDLFDAALPIILERGAEVISAEITETKLYVKAILPSMEMEIPGKVGDIVQAGIVISNSEVGAGSLAVTPLVYRLICLNGMKANDAFRRYHVGRQSEVEQMVAEVTSERTQRLSDAALWSTVKDVVRASFDRDVFGKLVDKMGETTTREIKSDNYPAVVEMARKQLALPESTQNSILAHLIKGGDLNQFGMLNAITRASQDVESYELATEMEAAGGKVLELKPSDWEKIAEAEAVAA